MVKNKSQKMQGVMGGFGRGAHVFLLRGMGGEVRETQRQTTVSLGLASSYVPCLHEIDLDSEVRDLLFSGTTELGRHVGGWTLVGAVITNGLHELKHLLRFRPAIACGMVRTYFIPLNSLSFVVRLRSINKTGSPLACFGHHGSLVGSSTLS